MNTHGATVNRGEIVSMYAGLKRHQNSKGVDPDTKVGGRIGV